MNIKCALGIELKSIFASRNLNAKYTVMICCTQSVLARCIINAEYLSFLFLSPYFSGPRFSGRSPAAHCPSRRIAGTRAHPVIPQENSFDLITPKNLTWGFIPSRLSSSHRS